MSHIHAIESVFSQFKIDAKVVGASRGPSVTRYEVALGDGVRVEKIARLQGNLAYATAATSVRIQAPIPGRTAVGIELPNSERDVVAFGDLPATTGLTVVIGKDIDGEPVTADLAAMPHLLVAGTTGSGKSSFINSMLVSLIQADPAEVQLSLIDPKMIELSAYNGVPHLIAPVVTDVDEAVEALDGLVDEMESRYEAMRDAGVRSIDALGLPKIVVVIDELADLMMTAAKAVERSIVRLAQKSRAAGIHLVVATQRPSADVVTGLIKANVPSRLAFATASNTDSRVILGEVGAEHLLGLGDGLFKPVGQRAAVRVQSAYVSDDEVFDAVKAASDGYEAPARMAAECVAAPPKVKAAPPKSVGPAEPVEPAERVVPDELWQRLYEPIEDEPEPVERVVPDDLLARLDAPLAEDIKVEVEDITVELPPLPELVIPDDSARLYERAAASKPEPKPLPEPAIPDDLLARLYAPIPERDNQDDEPVPTIWESLAAVKVGSGVLVAAAIVIALLMSAGGQDDCPPSGGEWRGCPTVAAR